MQRIGSAYSLQCYVCTGTSNCNTAANCSSTDTYCQTTVVSAGIAGVSLSSVTKICTSACTAVSSSAGLASGAVYCCQTDLCNTSGAASIKSSSAVIFLALGIIVTVLNKSLLC
ncbi:lymphocyte antigen 6E-like [Hyperolius riggenbachi]|uniref:lymphocyte antigen 6E-like n=1 Tax=Hyperolius riggenbachi TaxID=752182 RepID=UPI0035A358B9